jgi:cytoskeletal protein CcmA (bactofilin family)
MRPSVQPGIEAQVSALRRFLGLADRAGRGYAPPADASTVVGAGMSVKGELKGEGTIVVLGSFEGDIVLDGTLHVGPEARVDANITANAIIVAGSIRGNLSANARVEILATGSLTGSVRSGSFTAADGAAVKGDLWVEPAPAPAVTS